MILIPSITLLGKIAGGQSTAGSLSSRTAGPEEPDSKTANTETSDTKSVIAESTDAGQIFNDLLGQALGILIMNTPPDPEGKGTSETSLSGNLKNPAPHIERETKGSPTAQEPQAPGPDLQKRGIDLKPFRIEGEAKSQTEVNENSPKQALPDAVRITAVAQEFENDLPAKMEKMQSDQLSDVLKQKSVSPTPEATILSPVQLQSVAPHASGATVISTEKPAPPMTAEIADKLHNVVSIIQDGNRIAVSLEPDGMGKLDINLSLDRGVLHAQLHVSDDQAKNMIGDNIEKIIHALAQEGLSVGGFTVSLRGNGQPAYAARENSDYQPSTNPVDGEIGTAPQPQAGLISIFA